MKVWKDSDRQGDIDKMAEKKQRPHVKIREKSGEKYIKKMRRVKKRKGKDVHRQREKSGETD